MLKRKLTLGIVALMICAPGCRLASDITHNVVFETLLCTDEVCSEVHYWRLAYSAWREYHGGQPGRRCWSDFGRGFRAGFVDYLKAGGSGCAPPIPPAKYWTTCSQTPEKREAALAWTEGFREGAAAAKASGYREQIVLPLTKCESTNPPGPAPHPPGPALPVPATPPPGPAVTAPPVQGPVVDPPRPEDLPAPRPVPRTGQSAPGGGVVWQAGGTSGTRPEAARTGHSSPGGVVWALDTAQPRESPRESPVRLSRDDPGTLFGGSTQPSPAKSP